ncbi:hypothetical protein FRC00_002665 [Tulasnella sp. 408]|nr:hypothetical protein FRC00_002665 [Tulasnella sp. 408]
MDIPEVSVHNLVNLNLNVVKLDPRGMRDLLAQRSPPVTPANIRKCSISLCDWYKELLSFLASRECPVKIDDLADLPLLPAIGRKLVISLNYARSGGIWWRSGHQDEVLTTVLLQLDVIMVDDLPDEPQGPNTDDLTRVLQLFGQLNLSPEEIIQRVDLNDWAGFVQHLMFWINDRFVSKLSAAEFGTLTNLPFFKGRKGRNLPTFVPASQVIMLPDLAPLDHLTQYLPPNSTFAAASPELAAVLWRSKDNNRSLSFSTLFSRLRLPSRLAPHQETSFSSLLQLIATRHEGHYNGDLIPDGNRVLRPPTELYDHRVPLFSTAFEGRDDLFVHPTFRHLIDGLVDLGVKRDITAQTLVESLQAVDHDAQQRPEPVHRARWLWDYVNSAPAELRQIPFDAIRRLRFLPRQTQRHPSDPDFDFYARGLPDVVSFDDLCAPEREVVAWTQRARFTTFPSAHLKAIYPNVGEPSPKDVVQHLVSLVNDVSPHHHQSYILFSNIRSVYEWLKKNKEKFKDQRGLLSKEPLWLNTDAVSDHWTWRTADQLVFDIAYDAEGRFVSSKSANTHDIQDNDSSSRDSAGQEIPAHRGMLAAVVPHFKTAFGGSFRESVITAEDTELPVYRLPEDEAASAFAVQSVVDYVYTGTFTLPTFADIDEATEALQDLLDLIELSNLWDIPDLTKQAVLAIVELRLIRFDNCDYGKFPYYDCEVLAAHASTAVLEIAEESQIELLIEICQKTKEQNRWL